VARITVNIPAPPAVDNTPPPAAPAVSIDTLWDSSIKTVLFDYDQADIRADQISTLQGNANFLKQHPNERFTIEGHADERGSQEYNLGLGDRRANAVKQWLVGQGIPEARMNVVSFGEERPECRETTEACYARNRRVAFPRVR
jgi:peptidoglycan-associated lipoprotein